MVLVSTRFEPRNPLFSGEEKNFLGEKKSSPYKCSKPEKWPFFGSKKSRFRGSKSITPARIFFVRKMRRKSLKGRSILTPRTHFFQYPKNPIFRKKIFEIFFFENFQNFDFFEKNRKIEIFENFRFFSIFFDFFDFPKILI